MKPITITLLICIFLVSACAPSITNFEECVAAGNPVMESYPRQCNAQGQTFVEEVEVPSDVTYVICAETVTGFDAEEFARQIGGVCVDECPDGYDPFMTQIGVEQCITHYGELTINSWPVCERSSADCNCVRAYETTTNDPIMNAEYRCVPEDYANRLIFRSGVDRLDEQGEQSVAIA